MWAVGYLSRCFDSSEAGVDIPLKVTRLGRNTPSVVAIGEERSGKEKCPALEASYLEWDGCNEGLRNFRPT